MNNVNYQHKSSISQGRLDQEFLQACQIGKLSIVKKLFNQYKTIPNINIKEDKALKLACNSGNAQLVEYLLESPELKIHSQLEPSKDYGFIYAAQNGNISVIQYLLDSSILITDEDKIKHNNNNYQALITSIKNADLELMSYLLNHPKIKQYVDIHYNDDLLFRWAIEKVNKEIVSYFIFEVQIEQTSAIKKSLEEMCQYGKVQKEKDDALEVMDMFEKRELKNSLENNLINDVVMNANKKMKI